MQVTFKVHAFKEWNGSREERVFSCKLESEAKRQCDRMIADGYMSYVTKIDEDGWEGGINYPPVPKGVN